MVLGLVSRPFPISISHFFVPGFTTSPWVHTANHKNVVVWVILSGAYKGKERATNRIIGA